jgi:hypothetical protein
VLQALHVLWWGILQQMLRSGVSFASSNYFCASLNSYFAHLSADTPGMNAASACHVQQNVATCKLFHCTNFYAKHISKRKESIVSSCVNTTVSNTISEGDGFGVSRTMGDNRRKKNTFCNKNQCTVE